MAINVIDWDAAIDTGNGNSSIDIVFDQDASPIPADGEIIHLAGCHETPTATPTFPTGFGDVTTVTGARSVAAAAWKKAASEASATFTISWDASNEMAALGWVASGCDGDALHQVPTAPSHVAADTVTVTTAETTVADTLALMSAFSFTSGGDSWSGNWDWSGSGATIGSSGLDVEPAPIEGGGSSTDDEAAGDWAIATSTGTFVGVSATHGGSVSDRMGGMIFVFEEESVAPTGAVPSRLTLLGVS